MDYKKKTRLQHTGLLETINIILYRKINTDSDQANFWSKIDK